MILQDKIQLFLSRAQSKICALSLNSANELGESYNNSPDMALSVELLDVIVALQDETLDWTEKEIEAVIDYYIWIAHLNDIAILSFENKLAVVIGSSQTINDWVPSFNSLSNTVAQNQNYTVEEIARLDKRIDNLDFSALVPQELIDQIDQSTSLEHSHSNKSVLDGIDANKIAEIGSNTTHRNDASKHISTAERNLWNAKVDTTALANGLATKAAVVHSHAISDVTGLEQALIDRNPIPGPSGADGLQPVLQAGTIGDGSYSMSIDSTNPALPILNLAVPKGVDGTDFHIDEYKISSLRLSSVYNNVAEGYSILGTDNGVLYFRNRFDDLGVAIPATTSTGWYATQFVGENGWSPILALEITSADRHVLKVVGWTGGTGTPPAALNVYVTTSGYSPNEFEAVNIKGGKGDTGIDGPAGKIMFPDASGDTVARALYDDELKDFVYLDTTLGLIYIKRSDTTANWSDGYQWKGDTGPIGPAGADGAGGGGGHVILDASTSFTQRAELQFLDLTVTDDIAGKTIVSAANKADKVTITGATKTKITYNSQGIVTGGADASQDDIGDGTTYKQYSQTEKTKLSGISVGANVGVVPNAAITPGTYSSVTVDAKGLVTGGADTPAANVTTVSTTAFPFTDLASKNTAYETAILASATKIEVNEFVVTPSPASLIINKLNARCAEKILTANYTITIDIASSVSGCSAIIPIIGDGASTLTLINVNNSSGADFDTGLNIVNVYMFTKVGDYILASVIAKFTKPIPPPVVSELIYDTLTNITKIGLAYTAGTISAWGSSASSSVVAIASGSDGFIVAKINSTSSMGIGIGLSITAANTLITAANAKNAIFSALDGISLYYTINGTSYPLASGHIFSESLLKIARVSGVLNAYYSLDNGTTYNLAHSFGVVSGALYANLYLGNTGGSVTNCLKG